MSSTCTPAPTSPPRWAPWPQPPTLTSGAPGVAGHRTAADYAHTHRYADTTTAAPTGCEHLQAGRWQLPTGSLVIVDDADHLPAGQLAWLTEHAAATNTKLLLLTNPAPGRTPAHTLTAVAATHLPWAQHLGTPDPTHRATLTAIEHAATHLATVTDADIHTPTAELLARRDQLTAGYHTLTRDHSADRDHTLTRTATTTTDSNCKDRITERILHSGVAGCVSLTR